MKFYTKYHMKANLKIHPFPHTEFTTNRPNSKPYTLWDDLVNFLANIYLDPDKWGWVFRGVSKADYPLEGKLERELKGRVKRTANLKRIPDIHRQTAEDYLLAKFKRAAHHFLEASMVPDNIDNRLEWLSLMQHFGAPTRLLDFTRSPYVACFFALEKPDENLKRHGKRAIWAINATWLIKNSLGRIKSLAGHRSLTSRDLLDSRFMAKYFDQVFVNNSVSVILPIVPPRSNPRLLVQQGLFLCPGAVNKSFQGILSSYKDEKDMQESVNKIVIDSRIRHEVLSELHFMNISRASLFPDLEGFATSLKHEIYYKSSDEIAMLR